MNNQGGNQGYPYGQPSNFNGNQGYPYGQGINQNGTNTNLGVQPNVEYQQPMNYQQYQQVPNGTVPGNENNTNKKKSKKIFAFVAIAIIVITVKFNSPVAAFINYPILSIMYNFIITKY